MSESKSDALPLGDTPIFFGAPGKIRTPDTRIRSPLLYPTELQALIGAGEGNRTLATGLEGQGSTTELHPQVFGGWDWIRTSESEANGFTVRPLWPTREPILFWS